MRKFEFSVDVIPKGKARPRFVRMGKAVRTYTPKTTHDYEKQIAEAFLEQGGKVFDYPCLEVYIVAYFPIPKNTRKADRLLMETSYVWYNKKPDTDNVAKSVLDGLNGIAWIDDKQVVSLKVKKYYGKEPHVNIRIKEVETNDSKSQ